MSDAVRSASPKLSAQLYARAMYAPAPVFHLARIVGRILSAVGA